MDYPRHVTWRDAKRRYDCLRVRTPYTANAPSLLKEVVEGGSTSPSHLFSSNLSNKFSKINGY